MTSSGQNDNNNEVVSITLDKTSATLTPGEILLLEATILPENAANKGVTWTSSNDNTATVQQNGEVTAKATGTTVITACRQ